MTQELVRGTINLLVANMYWMVAFKIHVLDASLFEGTQHNSRYCSISPILLHEFCKINDTIYDDIRRLK